MCFDARQVGFDTHNVKDRSGTVICPVLLNTKCHLCQCYGHTPKYCKNNLVNIPQTQYLNKDVCLSVEVGGGEVGTGDNGFHNSLQTTYVFNSFAILQKEQADEVGLIDEFDECIWGVGLRSMIGKNWADVCGA